jgi:hypothetical protein
MLERIGLALPDLREVYTDLGAERRGGLPLLAMTRYETEELSRSEEHRPPPLSCAPRQSIAVMNFTNISRNAADDWEQHGEPPSMVSSSAASIYEV